MEWKDYFYYDELSPTKLRWKVDRYGGHNHATISRKAHSVAGNFHYKPCGTPLSTCVKLDNKIYKVHRVIWEMFNDPIPEGMVIDHLNGDPWDNRLENLECKTSSGNCTNRKKRSDNKSGKTGVSLTKRGDKVYWCATFMSVSGKISNRTFSVTKYGNDEAFRLACECREEKIKELNSTGVWKYTERHGI